jgi:hypothetical protein
MRKNNYAEIMRRSLMNKTAIGLFAAVLPLVSCDPLLNSKDQRLTNSHYIINPTGKRMIHELTFSVPREHRDSTLRYYSNGANNREELEWIISYAVGKGKNTQAAIGYSAPFCLYNIDDTTFLSWDKYWREYDDTVVFRPFYWKHDGETSDDKENNWMTNYYLAISDSLLSLMRKDYAMLNKFSEYYAKKQ